MPSDTNVSGADTSGILLISDPRSAPSVSPTNGIVIHRGGRKARQCPNLRYGMEQTIPLVYIEWVDSHRSEGWHTDDPAQEPLLCRSVGWLVYDGEKAKTIAPHMTQEDDPQRCGEMTIPTSAVLKISVLHYPNWRGRRGTCPTALVKPF